MNAGNSNDKSYLDRIRLEEGADKCRAVFHDLFCKDPRRAVGLLNDQRLTFPCLYLLRDEVRQPYAQRYLNARNRAALRIAEQIKAAGPANANELSSKRDAVYVVLKWILETGVEEIPEDDYEEVLDVTVSVLINTYGDRDVVPLVVELIFARNRRGRYTHDLVWALFRIHDPEVLKLIAQRVKSPEEKDAELAANLLNLEETDVPAENDKEGRYAGYLQWLEENQPYLYFTQESFQYASNPAFTTVDHARKYLQKGDASYDKQPVSPSDEEEEANLAAFAQLPAEEQKALSGYAQKIRNENAPAWEEWRKAPLPEQIKAAKAGKEGGK